MDAAATGVGRSAVRPGISWARVVRRGALALSFLLIIASAVLAFLSLQQLRGPAGQRAGAGSAADSL